MIATIETTAHPLFLVEREMMPDEARDEIALWERILTKMERLARTSTIKQAAGAVARGKRGFSAKRIITKYYEWLAEGRMWTALVNKVKWGRYLEADDFNLPDEFVSWWKGEQMGVAGRLYIRPLWKESVLARYRRWRAGDVTAALPGLGETCPDPNPRTGVPPGCSYRNLSRPRFVLTADERAATEQGENAVAMRMPPVFTDRAQLYFGQFFMVDDLWHDHLVNVDGERGARRPLELHMLELFSSCKNLWGMIPIRENEETGRMERLKEKEMLWLIVAFLARDGFHPNGTTILAENGTATLPGAVVDLLREHSQGKLNVEFGAMRGKISTFAGQYAGVEKGNFKFKAALESFGKSIHDAMQALPGQVGLSADRQPSEIHGLTKLNNALLRALAALPEATREALRFPIMDFTMFRRVAAEIYRLLNGREDHELQGWRAAGLTAQEWRAGANHAWSSQNDYLALAAPAKAAVDALIQTDPETYARVRDLAPAEVYARHRSELVKMPNYILPRILGRDLAKEVTVRQRLFTFTDREYGPGEHRYEAVVRDEDGRNILLRDGETYQLFVTPFWAEGGFVCDAKGAYLGTTKRWTAPSRADADALRAQYARVKEIQSAVLNPLSVYGQRILRRRAADAVHNSGVLAAAGGRPRPTRTRKKPAAPRSRNRADADLNAELLAQSAET